jgi:hypothetical protein
MLGAASFTATTGIVCTGKRAWDAYNSETVSKEDTLIVIPLLSDANDSLESRRKAADHNVAVFQRKKRRLEEDLRKKESDFNEYRTAQLLAIKKVEDEMNQTLETQELISEQAELITSVFDQASKMTVPTKKKSGGASGSSGAGGASGASPAGGGSASSPAGGGSASFAGGGAAAGSGFSFGAPSAPAGGSRTTRGGRGASTAASCIKRGKGKRGA